jgi:hypothetical protein
MDALNNYRIGVASRTYDLDGAVMLVPLPGDTAIRAGERRVTRTKTLDGGCVITDGGVSAGDRTFDVVVQSDRTLWGLLWALFQAAQWVTVTTEESCFLAKLQRISEQDGKISMNILIKEDLTV